jgi:hypothetical protein
MSRTKKLIVLGVMVAIIGSFVYFAPRIMSFIQSFSNSYTKLTVQTGLYGGSYDIGTNKWLFSYYPAYTVAGLPVSASLDITDIAGNYKQLLDIAVGTSLTWDGLEIKVSEIYPAYLVLLVKPE